MIFFVFLLTIWSSFYIDLSAYSMLGRNFGNTTIPLGPVDWLIGHESGFDYWKSWFHQLVGLSFTGLMTTAVPGFVFYCCGYGWETMMSGSLMGLLFELGYRIPFPFPFSDISLGEFIFGFWLWLVLLISGIGRRAYPKNSPRYIPGMAAFVFSTVVTVIITVMIATSMIMTWIDTETPARNRTGFGLTVILCCMLLFELCFGLFIVYLKMKYSRGGYTEVMDNLDLDESSIQKNKPCGISSVYIPQATPPFNVLLVIIRFLTVVWMLCLAILVVYVIIYDRIIQ